MNSHISWHRLHKRVLSEIGKKLSDPHNNLSARKTYTQGKIGIIDIIYLASIILFESNINELPMNNYKQNYHTLVKENNKQILQKFTKENL